MRKLLRLGKEKLRVKFNSIQVTSKHAKTFPKYARLLTTETLYLQKVLVFKKYKKCLDIGCGYGRLTNILAHNAEQYVGLEPERKLFRIAKKLYPDHVFVNAKADSIPFKNNSFNLIVSWTVLQHVKPQIIEKSINEIKRVATEDALIILAEHTGETTSNFTFGRRVEAYCRLLKPFTLMDSFPRYVYEGDNTGTVMIFRKTEKEEK